MASRFFCILYRKTYTESQGKESFAELRNRTDKCRRYHPHCNGTK